MKPEQKLDNSSGNDNKRDSQTAHVRATIVKNLFNMLFFVIALFAGPSHIDHHLDKSSASTGFTYLYLRRTEAMISVLPAFGGYLLGVIACSMCIQLYSFLIPLCLAPIVTLFFAVNMDFCPWFGNDLWCRDGARAVVENNEYISVLLVVMGQIFYCIYNYVATASGIHEKELNMFWFPQHTGVLTGQHMLLNRTKITENLEESSQSAEGQQQSAESPPQSAEDPPQGDLEQRAKDLGGRVMICTTMYRETWDEMSKYLDSIKRVAASDLDKLVGNESENSWAGQFEAHVYFDNGLRGDKLTDFSAQLVCLVKDKYPDSVEIPPRKTWYGWKLRWDLSGSLRLPLTIHLKDNQKVKSKKRWSQVMYMESAVDSQRNKEINKRVKYILATDGDVDFDASSIVAMLLQMKSDREGQVGAVCARTHPVGSGPFVWYQMFDYAIGHWLQKVANHVLGSVLCAPGCFTVYRVEAIADVLEEYRSDVEEASDFLTKDMGEDRWFTTLLVKAGYKINYCAGASDSTHCPEEFDEFWKQRRRWIPSTLLAKILCYIFLLAMLVAVVGTVSQMVVSINSHKPPLGTGPPATCFCGSEDDMKNGTKLQEDMCAFPCPGDSGEFCGGSAKPGQISVYNINELIWIKLPVDVTTLYLAIVVGIHFVAAVLHPGERSCIIYGVVYLFTLPCVYILMNVYSVCNMTDRSWGTREARSQQDQDKDKLSYDIVTKLRQFWTFCKACCLRSSRHSDQEANKHTKETARPLHNTSDAESSGFEGRERNDTADGKGETQPLAPAPRDPALPPISARLQTRDCPEDLILCPPMFEKKSY
ncbi:chitin synthase chs-1-like [Branchiostoma floridae]|uniref:chitin synthase n=1 Tax=Branchiostoma floridae TaxID=7739 RepID=A0A9J7KSV1_BRAFL|nr:chitin synthase chs-1-like [Branchiostoma floridae]